MKIALHWALMRWIEKVNVFLTMLSLGGTANMSDRLSPTKMPLISTNFKNVWYIFKIQQTSNLIIFSVLFETVNTKSLNRLFPLVSNIYISSAIEGHRDSFKQLPFICGRPRYWCKLMSLNCDWWMADGSTVSRWLTRTSAPPGKITRPSWEAASLSIARWECFSSKLGPLPGFKDNKKW